MIIVDSHCDTASLIKKTNQNLFNNKLHLDIQRMKSYDKYIQSFAFWINPKKSYYYKEFLDMYKYFKLQVDSYFNHMIVAKSKKEIESNLNNNKIICLLSLEGCEVLEGRMERLDELYNLGIRLVSLTWNYSNEAASGIMDNEDTGLTEFGKDLIRKLNNIGIIIDVSHISEKGFWQIIELTNKPIIASHSNSKNVCNNKRNINDEQYKAIIDVNGAIGINFYTEFLTDKSDATIDDIISHIEHFLELGGQNNIGLGSDFDGIDKLPKGIEGCQDIHEIPERLLKLNYSEELVDKIMGENMLNVYKNVLN